MADLEALVQKMELDATGYMNALDQARVQLARTGQASTTATAGMARGFTSASRGITTSLGAATKSSTAFRFSLGQLTRQVGEFGNQVAAGRNPIEAFTRNLSQALVFMGPMGAAAGIASVALGALAQSFFSTGRDAEEMQRSATDLSDVLETLGDDARIMANRIVEAFEKASGSMRELGAFQLRLSTDQLREDEAEALATFDRLTDEIRDFAERRIAFPTTFPEEQELAGELVGLRTALDEAEITRERFVDGLRDLLRQLVASGQGASDTAEQIRSFISDISEATLGLSELERRLAAASAATQQIVPTGPPLPPGAGRGGLPPEFSLRGEREIEAIREQIEAEKKASRGRKPRTFAEATEGLEQELTLLKDVGRTREQINQILQVQRAVQRELTADERDHLLALVDATGVLETQHVIRAQTEEIGARLAAGGGRETEELRVQLQLLGLRNALGERAADQLEEQVRLQEELRSELQAQAAQLGLEQQTEDLRLQATFSGLQTDEYREQNAMLRLARDLHVDIADLTAEQRADVEAMIAAQSNLQLATTRTQLRQGTEQTRLGLQQGPETQFRGLFNIGPSREQLAAQERLRFQQQGLTQQDISSLEPMIEEAARLNAQYDLMMNTVPGIADGLADIAQTAVFEGLDEAGQQFLKTLVNMMFQVIALQAVMAAFTGFGAFGGAAPINTTGAGGAGFSLPIFGGPRQHGGRVDPSKAFMVGEAGPELFVPDTSGMIVPRGDRGGGGSALGASPITINNYTSAKVETQQDPRGGGTTINISEMLAAEARPGTPFDKALRSRYGLNFTTNRR